VTTALVRSLTTASTVETESLKVGMARTGRAIQAGLSRGFGIRQISSIQGPLPMPARPLVPDVDCYRDETVIVWGTLRAPFTNT
jgi:hypothetical protein